MARKLEVEIVGDASRLNRSLQQSGSTLGKFSKAAALAGGAAALGAVAFGAKKAIDAASDLNESINAVNVVFGKASGRIHNFSKKAAREAGLSMRELNELVTPLGAAFTNLGDSQDVAAQKSIALAKRAADMASVFNVDVKDALGAIQAGLRGESDPLEKFGVGLNDAAITAKVLEDGLAKTKAEITGGDKGLARYALIMQQTEKVAGDFHRTSGGLANQQRILGAEFENLTANIGNKLIPILTTAVVWIGDHWPAAAKKLEQVWKQNVQPALADFAEFVGVVVGLIKKHWGTIGPILNTVINLFKNAMKQIQNILNLFTAIFKGDWSAAWKAIKDIVGTALHQIGLLLSLFKDTLLALGKKLGMAILNGIWDGIKSLAGWFKDKITGLFHSAIDWIKGVLGINSPSTVFHDLGVNMIKGMVNGIGSMGGYLKDAVIRLAKSVPGKVVSGIGLGSGSTQGLKDQVWQAIAYAKSRGWSGEITSGFRSYAEQSQLYQRYLAGGPLAAKPGTSSHERGEAVDVTDYGTFARIMSGAPPGKRLYNYLGARDPVHFSVSGYAKGGIFNRPTLGVIGERGPEAVVPLSRGGGRPQQVNLVLDGRTLASVLIDPLRNQVKLLEARGGAF